MTDRSIIPRRPLLWLAAALVFVVPTLFGSVATWVPLVFLACLLAKFWMEQRDRRLRSMLWKIGLAAAGFGAVAATYGSPAGVEPGISVLVLLASLKILESHTARDFQVLVMIGWVLCLCAFLLSQDFSIALCVLAAFVLLATALIDFHAGRTRGRRIAAPFGFALKLLVQALPLILVLFLLFPRATVGLRLRTIGQRADSTGFSGQLSPGSVAAVASSDDLAFRVQFPDGNMPPRAQMYWRGAVLSRGDGLTWDVGTGIGMSRQIVRPPPGSIRQSITVEPHANHWLFALDRPLAAPPGATLLPGRYLSSFRPISSIRRYEVISSTGARDAADLQPRERAAALALPHHLSAEIAALVQSWTAQSTDPRAVVRQALEFFRTQGFVYSLAPGQYNGPAALDDLLFRRKSGFCEHYAAAFATLMRVAGIPSRVVLGYLGGEFNQYGNYLLVRQSDAHAWCEVWLPDSGWTRVDPTSVIAPERVDVGSLRHMLTQSLQARTNTRQPMATGSIPEGSVLNNARLAWDSVNYAWDSHVLSFDVDGQREFFSAAGLGGISPMIYVLSLAGFVILLLAAYAAWLRWRGRKQPDRVKALYDAFCRSAAQLGVARTPVEGPCEFARRAAVAIPRHGSEIRRIADRYVALRYSDSGDSSDLAALSAAVSAFAKRRARERVREPS